MRWIIFTLSLAFLCNCAVLSLTWEEAANLAERNNNDLGSARKQVEISEWSYRQSLSAFLPQLSASAGLSETLSATTAASASYSFGLSAVQNLFQPADLFSAQAAYNDIEQKRASYLSTRASVLYDVRSAFIDLQVSQANVDLLQKILGQRKRNTELVRLRYDSGKEDKGNYLTTGAEEANAEYDLAAARRELELARLNLSQLLNADIVSVEGEAAVAQPAAENLELLLRASPDYILAGKQLEAAEISRRASLAGFLPSVSLSGSYRRTGAAWPPDTDNRSWSLNFSYAFFPGGSHIAGSYAAAARLDQAGEDFSAAAKELRLALRRAFLDFKNALEALKVSDSLLVAARERARITEAKYLNGLAGYDEWYRLQNNYVQAEKNLLTARKRALLAAAAWFKSYGGYVK